MNEYPFINEIPELTAAQIAEHTEYMKRVRESYERLAGVTAVDIFKELQFYLPEQMRKEAKECGSGSQ